MTCDIYGYPEHRQKAFVISTRGGDIAVTILALTNRGAAERFKRLLVRGSKEGLFIRGVDGTVQKRI